MELWFSDSPTVLNASRQRHIDPFQVGFTDPLSVSLFPSLTHCHCVTVRLPSFSQRVPAALSSPSPSRRVPYTIGPHCQCGVFRPAISTRPPPPNSNWFFVSHRPSGVFPITRQPPIARTACHALRRISHRPCGVFLSLPPPPKPCLSPRGSCSPFPDSPTLCPCQNDVLPVRLAAPPQHRPGGDAAVPDSGYIFGRVYDGVD